jgi:hypothetical protein
VIRVNRGTQQVASAMLAACAAYQVALGVYFIVWRPSLLPEDLRFMKASADALRDAPGLAQWLQRVFAVMGGQMIAVGMLVLLAAARYRKGNEVSRADLVLLAIAAALSVGLMSAVNFAIDSDFRFLLLVPVVLWISTLVLLSRPASR